MPATLATRTSLTWRGGIFDYSGYARVARELLLELDRHHLPIRLESLSRDPRFLLDLQRAPASHARFVAMERAQPDGGAVLTFHPATLWDGASMFRTTRVSHPGARAHIGFTMFETDRLPRGWAAECAAMDQVWVPSRFCLETFVRGGVPEDRLRLWQPGIDLRPFAAPVAPRALPGPAAFTFLSVFQWTLRKGPDLLLHAWLRAFRRDDPVRLVLRTYPGVRKEPPIRARIDAMIRGLGYRPEQAAPIELIEEFVPEADMPALYAAADAFVLPTRGEGFGLPYLEAMAMGLPVLGTRWSGPLDFLRDDNSYLIDVEGLEPVAPEHTEEDPYYAPEHQWARPSVEHLASLLRHVVARRDEARARGARAREQVHAEWSVAARAPQALALLEEACAGAVPARRPSPAPAALVWSAPLYDPSGYADEARAFVLGLRQAGCPVRAVHTPWSRRFGALAETEILPLAELQGTPVQSRFVHVQHGFPSRFLRTPGAVACVGRTMFETDRLPEGWAARCNAMDEVWVPSDFNLATFATAGVDRGRLRKVHAAFDASRFTPAGPDLPLPHGGGFHFLSVFDFGLRKGWDVLLRAYVSEFQPEEDVCLFLRVHSSAGLVPQQIQARLRRFLAEELGRDPAGIPDLWLLPDDLSAADYPGLYRAVHAYVMPSRGEGWGRPAMEAMACGLPVIATAYGGPLEFLDARNAYLLDWREVEVSAAAAAEAPFWRGHRWAEPNVDHLRALLREVFVDREGRTARAARAQAEVRARFDRPVVARAVVGEVARLLRR